MQPQNQPPSPQPAGNSDPNYNFIFNNNQGSKKKFSLPGGSNLAKFAILIVGGGAVLGVLIIVLSSIFSPKVNTKELTDVVARAQEISRVSDIISLKSRDINTANLASTTSAALTSEKTELLTYMAQRKHKVNPKDEAVYLNKTTDSEIEVALQNNRLSDYYNSYLKKNLSAYENSIKTAYNTAGGSNLKVALNNYSISTTTILKTQQLVSAQ
jgi:hypothetical protein